MAELSLPSDDEVRALADLVLARPEYASWRRAPGEAEALLRAFDEWIDRLVDALFGFLTPAADFLLADDWLGLTLRLLVAVPVVAAIVVGAVRLVRTLRSAAVPKLSEDSQTRREAGLLDQADGLALAGRFVEAARCVQLATLELLLRGRWLELERSDANPTLRRRLADAELPAAEKHELVELLDRLESRWFRDRVEDRGLYRAWRALHGRLLVLEAR